MACGQHPCQWSNVHVIFCFYSRAAKEVRNSEFPVFHGFSNMCCLSFHNHHRGSYIYLLMTLLIILHLFFSLTSSWLDHFVGKNVAGSNELLYVKWVMRQIFAVSFVFRQCCRTSLHDHPEERSDSLMAFRLFTETTCCCEEGCKVNLFVFEVRVAPHWLSLYSLITLYISSSLPLSLSHTHSYQCFELWLKLAGVSLCIFFFAPLWSVVKG